MDSEFIEEDTDLISRKKLFFIRKQKLQKEIEAARRILNENVDPLYVADRFLHNIFELIKDGISNRFPKLTELEISQKVRENISLKEKIISLKKRNK